MRRAVRRISRSQKVIIETLPAPLGGWNTRDYYFNPSSRRVLNYARRMENIIVSEGGLFIRPGYSSWSTGIATASDEIETLMEYKSVAGVSTIFGVATDGKIYNVTASGAVGAAVVTGLTNARFQHLMFATTSGNYLVAVNGADGVRTWSGAAWASQSITGVTAGNLINLAIHQNRLWFVEVDTLNAYYLPPYSISGTVTKFNIGSLCRKGGYLMAIGTLTVDGGRGPEDQLVFITSEGEAIIYSGIDPNSTGTWTLVGVYQIDKPLGRRCLTKFGGDLAILTESGVVLLSQVLGSVDGKDQMSDPIRDEFVKAVAIARGEFGWSVTTYTKRAWLIVNVPLSTTGEFEQFVLNTLMGAWFKFTDLNAYCWCSAEDSIHFGGLGTTYKWDDGSVDDNGSNISAVLGFAWFTFGVDWKKQFTMMKVNLKTDGTVTPLVKMSLEYDESDPTATAPASSAPVGSVWDEDDWDEGVWGGGLAAYSRWTTVSGEAIVAAPLLKINTISATVGINSVNVGFIRAGVI